MGGVPYPVGARQRRRAPRSLVTCVSLSWRSLSYQLTRVSFQIYVCYMHVGVYVSIHLRVYPVFPVAGYLCIHANFHTSLSQVQREFVRRESEGQGKREREGGRERTRGWRRARKFAGTCSLSVVPSTTPICNTPRAG